MSAGVRQEHRVDPSPRLISVTVAISQRKDSLLGQALLDAPHVPGASPIAGLIDPHAVRHECGTLASGAIHRTKNLGEHGPEVLIERLPAPSDSCRRESRDLGHGEVDRRQRCAPIKDIAAAGAGSGRDWKACLLKGGDIPFDRTDADFEHLRQLIGRPASPARATQLFPDSEKSVGAIHPEIVTYR